MFKRMFKKKEEQKEKTKEIYVCGNGHQCTIEHAWFRLKTRKIEIIFCLDCIVDKVQQAGMQLKKVEVENDGRPNT
jgi:hypothetical protein